MIRRPPRSTRTDTLFPYTTRFRSGRLVVNGEDARLAQVLAMGCWTPVETFGLDDAAAVGGKPFDWSARLVEADGSVFAVLHAGSEIGTVRWPLLEIGRAHV